MNLFDIEFSQRATIDELIENGGDLTPELEARLAISLELFEAKAQSYALVIKEMKVGIEQLDEIIESFEKKKASLKRSQEQLKDRLLQAMLAFDIPKYKTVMVNLWVGYSDKLVIHKEDDVPNKFKNTVVTIKIDGAALKAALKAGTVKTDSASVASNPFLQVR